MKCLSGVGKDITPVSERSSLSHSMVMDDRLASTELMTTGEGGGG